MVCGLWYYFLHSRLYFVMRDRQSLNLSFQKLIYCQTNSIIYLDAIFDNPKLSIINISFRLQYQSQQKNFNSTLIQDRLKIWLPNGLGFDSWTPQKHSFGSSQSEMPVRKCCCQLNRAFCDPVVLSVTLRYFQNIAFGLRSWNITIGAPIVVPLVHCRPLAVPLLQSWAIFSTLYLERPLMWHWLKDTSKTLLLGLEAEIFPWQHLWLYL